MTTEHDRDVPRELNSKLRAWVDTHRQAGHHPRPAPTAANPERWECECDPDSNKTAVWRTLTPEQIMSKFAHLKPLP